MVFKEKIKAELKAYVRFLREEGDVPVKGIYNKDTVVEYPGHQFIAV